MLFLFASVFLILQSSVVPYLTWANYAFANFVSAFSQHLTAILEFMYAGEVNVAQDQLPQFLKTAERLKVSFYLVVEVVHFKK